MNHFLRFYVNILIKFATLDTPQITNFPLIYILSNNNSTKAYTCVGFCSIYLYNFQDLEKSSRKATKLRRNGRKGSWHATRKLARIYTRHPYNFNVVSVLRALLKTRHSVLQIVNLQRGAETGSWLLSKHRRRGNANRILK